MICVIDFDRTFMKNDFFMEVFLRKVLQSPLYIFSEFLIKRKSLLEIKQSLLHGYIIQYDFQRLINPAVKKWISENRASYEQVVIVSASPDFFVNQLIGEDPLFDKVHGSTDQNLKGRAKLAFIQSTYGMDFDYLGDSKSDIPIFEKARNAYQVKGEKITLIEK